VTPAATATTTPPPGRSRAGTPSPPARPRSPAPARINARSASPRPATQVPRAAAPPSGPKPETAPTGTSPGRSGSTRGDEESRPGRATHALTSPPRPPPNGARRVGRQSGRRQQALAFAGCSRASERDGRLSSGTRPGREHRRRVTPGAAPKKTRTARGRIGPRRAGARRTGRGRSAPPIRRAGQPRRRTTTDASRAGMRQSADDSKKIGRPFTSAGLNAAPWPPGPGTGTSRRAGSRVVTSGPRGEGRQLVERRRGDLPAGSGAEGYLRPHPAAEAGRRNRQDERPALRSTGSPPAISNRRLPSAPPARRAAPGRTAPAPDSRRPSTAA